jgi:zinc transport system ATP-binding protein
LEGITLDVREGDFLGVIGPNGGGKTTLLKVVLGLVKPARGEVRVLGGTPHDGRRRIGYVPQHSLFDRDFPINVVNAVLMGRNSRLELFKRYDKRDKDLATETLETVGLLSMKNRQIGELSGGEQQRVFIARALVSEPKILLLDEPTASIDTAMQTEFYELLDRLKQRITIIMVSHDISAISVYVDNIACLNIQLHYHGSTEISTRVLEKTYKCPVQMIAHGTIPHRVLKEH